MIIFWIFLLSVWVVPNDLLGKVYHFSPMDSMETLEQMLVKLRPGDTLFFEPGEYLFSEGITISKRRHSSGESGKPITLKAKGRVILNGMNQAPVLLRIEGDYWKIEGLILKWSKTYGILIKGNHIQVKDNEIIEAGQDGIKTLCGTRDVDLLDNRIVSPKEDGIDVFGTADGRILRNEIISSNNYGIFAKGGARNILIEGNKVFSPRQSGIFIGGFSDYWLMCGTYECTDCQATNNLVVGAGAHGVFAYGCLNGLIAHNTIIGANTQSGWGASLGAGAGVSPDTSNKKRGSGNVRIVNNIVAYPKSPIYLQVEESSAIDIYCDYNLYFGHSKPKFDWKGKSLTWDELKTVSGQEIHAILRDPQFKNLTLGDYHLQSQSPANSAGLPLDKVVEKDLSGNIRPKIAKPTLGAFE